ncbi:hypothetical protein [Noviherbaspirillum pedocola]|uniref:Uncharacterized protein n=1 Tax=Noviherbaspirillum pedocola TaxID=2801341 RepID=A0A934SV03_9BURK|nr:hypothetical protein [Noviherbaspirillum pedocola]MBK4735935.1 hypothetical protein [Noviherbaspirillum pedocola]
MLSFISRAEARFWPYYFIVLLAMVFVGMGLSVRDAERERAAHAAVALPADAPCTVASSDGTFVVTGQGVDTDGRAVQATGHCRIVSAAPAQNPQR